MDITVISDVITSLGIPIAFCIYMIWKEMKTDAKHQEQIDELRKVVEMNTLTVQRLADKLDRLGGEEHEGN